MLGFFGRLQDNAVLRLPLDRITPNSVSCAFAGHSTGIERWKWEDTIISRLARYWRFFGGFSAGSKTTVSCAYPLTELHQTRFLGLLQAIPPESSVRNGKIPVLADYANFAPWSNFWRFFGRLQDDAVLRIPLDRIALNSVSWAFAGHSTGIGCWKRKNTSISRLPQFCSLEQLFFFFWPAPRPRCPALTSSPNYTKVGFLCFWRPFHLNRALETGRHHY